MTLVMPETSISDFRKLAHPAELREYTSRATGEYCFDAFDKDVVGDVALAWLETATGVKEDEVVAWEELEPTEDDERWWFVLSAVTR